MPNDLTNLLNLVVKENQIAYMLLDLGMHVIESHGPQALLPAPERVGDERVHYSVCAPYLSEMEDILLSVLKGDSERLTLEDVNYSPSEQSEILYLNISLMPYSYAVSESSSESALLVIISDNSSQAKKYQTIVQQRNELGLLRDQLTTANQELEMLNDVKSTLFAIIAHDLKGPFTSLNNILELFQGGDLSDEELQNCLVLLSRESSILQNLLDNLLQWAKSQMQGLQANLTRLNLKDIIENIVGLLAQQAENKKIRLISGVATDFYLEGDADILELVIRNLVSNALKFTPENGTVTIKVVERHDNIEVSVVDTGIGMNEEVQAKLFQPNVRHSSVGTQNEKGSGLGLQLCHSFIKQHGGKMFVRSQLDKGSTFGFQIPMKQNPIPK
ncbi:MAG: HAMP domain-containing sensor histidine kinase [Pseudomonadota bacterium]